VTLLGFSSDGVYNTPVLPRKYDMVLLISFHPYQKGGFFSVALSISSRFPEVIWHPTL